MLQRLIDALYRLFDAKGRQQERLLQLQKEVALQEAARHEQQLELLEMVLAKVQEPHAANTQTMTEVAKAMQDQAQALHRWFGLFEQTQGEGMTHTIRPSDEADAAEKREQEKLAQLGYPVAKPPAEQAAWLRSMFGHDND